MMRLPLLCVLIVHAVADVAVAIYRLLYCLLRFFVLFFVLSFQTTTSRTTCIVVVVVVAVVTTRNTTLPLFGQSSQDGFNVLVGRQVVQVIQFDFLRLKRCARRIVKYTVQQTTETTAFVGSKDDHTVPMNRSFDVGTNVWIVVIIAIIITIIVAVVVVMRMLLRMRMMIAAGHSFFILAHDRSLMFLW